jgi:hypothetical protein
MRPSGRTPWTPERTERDALDPRTLRLELGAGILKDEWSRGKLLAAPLNYSPWLASASLRPSLPLKLNVQVSWAHREPRCQSAASPAVPHAR